MNKNLNDTSQTKDVEYEFGELAAVLMGESNKVGFSFDKGNISLISNTASGDRIELFARDGIIDGSYNGTNIGPFTFDEISKLKEVMGSIDLGNAENKVSIPNELFQNVDEYHFLKNGKNIGVSIGYSNGISLISEMKENNGFSYMMFVSVDDKYAPVIVDDDKLRIASNFSLAQTDSSLDAFIPIMDRFSQLSKEEVLGRVYELDLNDIKKQLIDSTSGLWEKSQYLGFEVDEASGKITMLIDSLEWKNTYFFEVSKDGLITFNKEDSPSFSIFEKEKFESFIDDIASKEPSSSSLQLPCDLGNVGKGYVYNNMYLTGDNGYGFDGFYNNGAIVNMRSFDGDVVFNQMFLETNSGKVEIDVRGDSVFLSENKNPYGHCSLSDFATGLNHLGSLSREEIIAETSNLSEIEKAVKEFDSNGTDADNSIGPDKSGLDTDNSIEVE